MKPGFRDGSISAILCSRPEEEWVASAYILSLLLQTDCSVISDDLFEASPHDYPTYLFRSRQVGAGRGAA